MKQSQCWRPDLQPTSDRLSPDPLAPFAPLLAHLFGAMATIEGAAHTNDVEMFRRGLRDLRNACAATEVAMQKAGRRWER